ncbi:type VII secretion protein EccCb [Streptomyces mirabilis]|uniref:DNA segregation ATPase FtsK/SpoIIIE, S-DNA-T family n=1 Tax=Streptomyces mirabilis TaxID=68239 RepID=A0A1I2VNK6_9ACTN|nr:type VII secretion protein EccCb [Streptomyces mirabilis]SFG90663.1 DNA segregation ATPase FtsK/SpoIIIE, S-DNA-T family [Streptomyces mirabilis]
MTRTALLVATTEYVDPGLRLLRSPSVDARRLGALLDNKEIGYFDQVMVLVNESKAAVEEHIEWLFQGRSKSDTVLLYFSCHGIRDRHGRLFFGTVRTRRDLPESTAVSARFVEEQLSRCRAGGKVLLLDCCYGGAFTQGMEPFAEDGGQLTAQVAGRGTYVMAASDALEFAYEGDQMQHRHGSFRSVFTDAVIEGLQTGQADADNDGVVTAHELFQYIQTHVRASGVPQTPTEFTSGVQGNIPIAKAALWHTGPGSESDPFLLDGLPLGGLLPALQPTEDRGLCAPSWPRNGTFQIPIGRMYEPQNGLQETLTLDLSGGAAHIGVVGGTWSGKTSTLSTIACSLALTHTPEELQIFGLHGEPDGLSRLRGLPHVGAVADYADAGQVQELVDGVSAALSRREALCGAMRIRSPRLFRARRTRGDIPEEKYGEIFLLIDSWPEFFKRYPEYARQMQRVAQSGAYFGIHLVLSANRWSEYPEELAFHLSTWIELSLANPQESRIDAGTAGAIPPGSPGIALTRGGRLARIALAAQSAPGAAARHVDATEDEALALDELVEGISRAWPGPKAVPLDRSTGVTGRSPRLLELLDVPDVMTFDPAALWARPRSTAQDLTAALGVSLTGETVPLDLKESRLGGSGPHGLLVGAENSGKSELLGSLCLGLAMTHSSERLNFVLVDFSGGATFLNLSVLPHVSAVVTNLADELVLVDRMRDAITGELVRRQELLRDAGNYASASDYEKARASGAPLAPLPTLLIVVDGFGELVSARPDSREMILSICRRGRSLGIHLLLAAQRVDEEQLRDIETYLSYRIALRTATAQDSRLVLGVSDAYTLPAQPGAGYLKTGANTMTRFQGAYASGAVNAFDSELEVVAHRMAGQGPPAHQVWLPPLNLPPSLDSLLAGLTPMPDRGLYPPDRPVRGQLVAPVGVIDKPFEQRRDVLWQDFGGSDGHMLITGRPQSGKSTLLRTLMASLAMLYTPQEVQFYGLDFGGGGMAALAGLPHTGGIASRLQPDLVRRTVSEVLGVLNEREEFFRNEGIDSIDTFRRRRAEGDARAAAHPWGDVFLIIDGWASFCAEHDALVPDMHELATRGLSYGVHLVLTASGPVEVGASLASQLGNRLELRLGDPDDSAFDGKAAADVPERMPGRGLTPERLHFYAAVPRIDGIEDAADLAAATGALCTAVDEAWTGPRAPTVRLLPTVLHAAELPRGDGDPAPGVAFAVEERRLQPVHVDFAANPFFLVYGDGESGKTSLLRLLAHQLAARYTPDQARLVVVDYLRSLQGSMPEAHLMEYVTSASPAADIATWLKDLAEKRLPGSDVTSEQLRNRSWWSGPTVYVLVDDYDLVVAARDNPLAALLDLLAFARDTGFRFIVASRSGGAGRLQFEPVSRRMTELGAQGVVLSGDAAEGPLLGGVNPRPLPPGRGTFVSRKGGTQLVQLGWLPES